MADEPMTEEHLAYIEALQKKPVSLEVVHELADSTLDLLAEVRRATAAEAEARAELAEWNQAQRHAAFVTCGHGLRHVTMLAFGQKIAEKRDALAQRAEATAEANRARKAEADARAEVEKLRAENAELQERSDWLTCLEHAGVDNWIGYDTACEIKRGM
ncbi:hypothetical protein OG216_09900 [Streptomycetaceae bacterium NBC_01309]